MAFKVIGEKTSVRINLSEDLNLVLKMLGAYYRGDNDDKSASVAAPTLMCLLSLTSLIHPLF